MLIEFTVKNYRSFKEEQTLSLVKGKGGEFARANTFTPPGFAPHGLLRSVAIYGPNASGKSNLLMAMAAMKRIVLDSFNEGASGRDLPVTPFLLNSKTAKEPSEFEVYILVDKVRYQYGFAVTAKRVVEEWLIAYPKGRPQRWLEREWNDRTHETNVLDQDLLRRDQVWFCEQDRSQASKLVALTDFRPRKGLENMEASYLSGRYGTLPCVDILKIAD